MTCRHGKGVEGRFTFWVLKYRVTTPCGEKAYGIVYFGRIKRRSVCSQFVTHENPACHLSEETQATVALALVRHGILSLVEAARMVAQLSADVGGLSDSQRHGLEMRLRTAIRSRGIS